MNWASTKKDDWYPTLSIRIGKSTWDVKQFLLEGELINGDFDTGATGILLSYSYLKQKKIIDENIDFEQFSTHLGHKFQYVTIKLKVALESPMGQAKPELIPCQIVKDFENSPLTQIFKSRKALIGRNIFNYFDSTTIELDIKKKITNIVMQDWKGFEKEVANLFRQIGLQVKRNINLSGNQIDIYLTEQTASGKTLNTIVECKFYKKPVGVQELKELSYVFGFAKSHKLADHAILVSSSGFTKDAFLIAETAGIELLEIEDLRVRAKTNPDEIYTTKDPDDEIDETEHPTYSRTAFVIMPFKDEYKDIYMLGFREVMDKYEYVCLRADEVEFNERILDKIRELIRTSDIIIAELTDQNCNVYYELGIAHTLNKTVILCTRDISKTPFDVSSFNQIVYNNIVELREKLSQRIESLITC